MLTEYKMVSLGDTEYYIVSVGGKCPISYKISISIVSLYVVW